MGAAGLLGSSLLPPPSSGGGAALSVGLAEGLAPAGGLAQAHFWRVLLAELFHPQQALQYRESPGREEGMAMGGKCRLNGGQCNFSCLVG